MVFCGIFIIAILMVVPQTLAITLSDQPVIPLAASGNDLLKDIKPSAETSGQPNQITPSLPDHSVINSSPKIIDGELLPHKATYTITLEKTDNEEEIAEVKGQMTIQIARIGEGWAMEQKSTLLIYYKEGATDNKEGTAEQVITNVATYESLDGLKYSFNARTLRGIHEECISGEALVPSKGGAGIVTYQQPDETTIHLPIGTVFPIQHLILLLNAAHKNQKVVSHIVFDGSSETYEPVQVNTVLGLSQDPKLALNNKDIFQAKKVWPMRMAIYAEDTNTPEADYEITQNVLNGGILRDMTLDYGSFKVKATLYQVEIFS
jgi:hypothetical protein